VLLLGEGKGTTQVLYLRQAQRLPPGERHGEGCCGQSLGLTCGAALPHSVLGTGLETGTVTMRRPVTGRLLAHGKGGRMSAEC